MLYPNNIKKDYQKTTTYSNRGMDLEDIIESTNEYYRDNDIAYYLKSQLRLELQKLRIVIKEKEYKMVIIKVHLP